MKIYSLFFIIIVLFLNLLNLIYAQVEELKQSDLQALIKQQQNALIFIIGGDRNSRKIIPYIEKVSQIIAKEQKNFKVAKIQNQLIEDEALKLSLKINTLPEIRLINQNEIIEYVGQKFDEAAIVSWVQRKLKDPALSTKFVMTKEEFERNSDGKDQAVIYVGAIEKSADFEVYKEVTKKFMSINFMHTTNLKKYLNISADQTDNMVMIFNYFQNETYVYKREDSWTVNDLSKFLKITATRSYGQFTKEVGEKFFKEKEAIIILLTDLLQQDMNYTAMYEFNNTREYFAEKMVLGYVDYADHWGNMLIHNSGKFYEDLPFVMLIEPTLRKEKIYILPTKEITSENIIKFYNDWTQKKLQAYFKSEEIPTTNDGPIKQIVSKNFNQFIYEENKDKNVIVLFYSRACRHCVNFKEIYSKLQENLKHNDNLVFAQIDVQINDLEDYVIESVPQVKIFSLKNKKKTLDVSQTILQDYDKMLKYMLKVCDIKEKKYDL